jgi:hypothetical protein
LVVVLDGYCIPQEITPLQGENQNRISDESSAFIVLS